MKVSIGNYPKKGERRVSVRIDDHDVWSLDATLALIIEPALKKLREVKHGSPYVENEDLPEELRALEEGQDPWTADKKFHERWDWVLNEMIWAFEQINADPIPGIGSTEREDRINRGLCLFGKYYRSLWD